MVVINANNEEQSFINFFALSNPSGICKKRFSTSSLLREILLVYESSFVDEAKAIYIYNIQALRYGNCGLSYIYYGRCSGTNFTVLVLLVRYLNVFR